MVLKILFHLIKIFVVSTGIYILKSINYSKINKSIIVDINLEWKIGNFEKFSFQRV